MYLTGDSTIVKDVGCVTLFKPKAINGNKSPLSGNCIPQVL
jgi:hypothetical protein